MKCLDKGGADFYNGAVIPDTLMRCVSKTCQARGINVDDEYVISYGDCTDIVDKVHFTDPKSVATYVSQYFYHFHSNEQ